MRVLLVRHGQSEWNAARRLQGQADIGLSGEGRAQAGRLRAVIEAIGPCRALTSDLKRARETADLIGAASARHEQGLREIGVGDWTGRDIDDLQRQVPDEYKGWRAGTYTPHGGETWEEFAARSAAVVEAEAETPCENLLFVCHGGVVRAVLNAFLGLDPSRIIPVAPASLTAFRLGNGKPTRLELFNYRPDQLDFEAPD